VSVLRKLYAETEFEKYRIVQDSLYESDFDRFSALEFGKDIETVVLLKRK